MGVGAKPWRLKTYVAAKKQEVEMPSEALPVSSDLEEIPVVKDSDGECFVRLSADGALLKVTAPIGRGKKVTDRMACDRLEARLDEHVIRVDKGGSLVWKRGSESRRDGFLRPLGRTIIPCTVLIA